MIEPINEGGLDKKLVVAMYQVATELMIEGDLEIQTAVELANDLLDACVTEMVKRCNAKIASMNDELGRVAPGGES